MRLLTVAFDAPVSSAEAAKLRFRTTTQNKRRSSSKGRLFTMCNQWHHGIDDYIGIEPVYDRFIKYIQCRMRFALRSSCQPSDFA